MERILMLAGDAAEELEVYYLLYRLREAGYEVDVAAPRRGLLRLVVHDFEDGWDTYIERPGRNLMSDIAFADVDPARYAGVVIPGGRAPEVIRTDPDVARILRHFDEHDLPIGTLCHGPQVTAALGLLQGRRSTAFPPLAPDIEQAGGTFEDAACVIDRNMVSSRGWGDLAEFSQGFLGVLSGVAAR
ncbi:MAG: DJ-1/PfpI family protein [Actinomycetota bacterium]|nr:DJ-1/PfpI family protein [Actinomycetota bacterium]